LEHAGLNDDEEEGEKLNKDQSNENLKIENVASHSKRKNRNGVGNSGTE
jgi:hypothetical protein